MALTDAQTKQVERIRSSAEVELGKKVRASSITPKIDKLILATQNELASFWVKRKKEIMLAILGKDADLSSVRKPNVYSSLKKLEVDDYGANEDDEDFDIEEPEKKGNHVAVLIGILGYGVYKILQSHARGAYKTGKDHGREVIGALPSELTAADRARIADELQVQRGYIDEIVAALSGDFEEILGQGHWDSLDSLNQAINDALNQADRDFMTGTWATAQRALGAGMEEGSEYPGGYWHIEDADACDGTGHRGSGCTENEGVYFTWDEFFTEYGTNDCYNNCRCMEHFEPAPFPGAGEIELMMKTDLLRGRDIATVMLEKQALLLGKFPATFPTKFEYKESMEEAGGVPGLRPTAILTGNDGFDYVWKEIKATEAASEELASRLAMELSLPTVEYRQFVWEGKFGVVSPFVDGTEQLRESGMDVVLNKGQIVQTLVFDAWIANTDRADRNILVKDGMSFLIDHGFSLAKRLGMKIQYKSVEKSRKINNLPVSWENLEPMIDKIEHISNAKIRALVAQTDCPAFVKLSLVEDLMDRRDGLRSFFSSWMHGERLKVHDVVKMSGAAGPAYTPGAQSPSNQRLDVQVPVREDLAKPSEWRRRRLKNRLPHLAEKNMLVVTKVGETLEGVEIHGLRPRNWLCNKETGELILGHGTHMVLWQAYGSGKFQDYCIGKFGRGNIQCLDEPTMAVKAVFDELAPAWKLTKIKVTGIMKAWLEESNAAAAVTT